MIGTGVRLFLEKFRALAIYIFHALIMVAHYNSSNGDECFSNFPRILVQKRPYVAMFLRGMSVSGHDETTNPR